MMSRPFIIGIAGSHSGVGKTALGETLIRSLLLNPAAFLRHTPPHVGAIKFTESGHEAVLVDDPAILREPGKDTARLAAAGADPVLWIRAARERLAPLLADALERLAACDAVVIEGNSAVRLARPDAILGIIGADEAAAKPSAANLRSEADIIVCMAKDRRAQTSPAGRPRTIGLAAFPYVFDETTAAAIIKSMETIDQDKKLESILRERAPEGRITCAAARHLAEELGIAYQAVGDAANAIGIKIKQCELGCFK
jgi:molybdopterin-guanine dinucleotide biosynthesis protein